MELHKNCIIDCRVSDPQQLQGGSLNDQEEIGRRKATQLGANVIKVFRKPHSATTTERDDFQEVLDFVRDSRNQGVEIHYYIIKSIDRFTRAGSSEYERMKTELEKVNVQMVDAHGMIQPKRNTLEHLGVEYPWSNYSPSEAGEIFTAFQSKQEARDILFRLIGAEIRLVQEGYAVRRPPDGFLNRQIFVDGKKKVIREPDPERVSYFQKMFQLRAEGMPDQEIVDQVNAMGFRTRNYHRWDRRDKEHPKIVGQRGGVLLTVKQLQRYIPQTEYAGVIYEKWTYNKPIKARYDGMVSVDTYNRANRGKRYIDQVSFDAATPGGEVMIRHNYSPWGKVRRLKSNPEFPHKWVRCHLCNSELLGSGSTNGKTKKRYQAYHCGGIKTGKRNHTLFRVQKSEFEESVNNYLDSLKFHKGFLAGFELHLIDQYRQREKDIVLKSSAISKSVSDLKAEQAQKLEAFGFAETQLTRRKLEEQISELDIQIQEAESQRGKIEITEKSIKAFIRYAKEIMEHPAEILANADDLHTKRLLVSLFFEETPTYEQILNGTPKLQAIFKLSEEFKINKSQLVTLAGVEPAFRP